MFHKWNVGVFDTNDDYTFQITFLLGFLIFCEIEISKRFLTLEETKDFVFESDVLQISCENIVILPPDVNNANSDTEDLNNLVWEKKSRKMFMENLKLL